MRNRRTPIDPRCIEQMHLGHAFSKASGELSEMFEDVSKLADKVEDAEVKKALQSIARRGKMKMTSIKDC